MNNGNNDPFQTFGRNLISRLKSGSPNRVKNQSTNIFEPAVGGSYEKTYDYDSNDTIREILGDILEPRRERQTGGNLTVDTTSATSLVNPGQIGGGMSEDYYKLKYLKYKTKVMKLRSQM